MANLKLRQWYRNEKGQCILPIRHVSHGMIECYILFGNDGSRAWYQKDGTEAFSGFKIERELTNEEIAELENANADPS